MEHTVEVAVEGVVVHKAEPAPGEPGDKYAVGLKEKEGTRRLSIWIGPTEAFAIASKLGDQVYDRPFTSDLAARLIRELGATLDAVVITRYQEKIFYALLVITHQGGKVDIDARPSDAIAIALRLAAPILVVEEVFEQAVNVA